MRRGLRRSMVGVTVAGAWLLGGGCQDPPSPRDRLPDPTQVGEHLRFYTEDDGEQAMCAGTLPYMDRYIDALIRLHGTSPDLLVDYYWFPTNQERIDEICSATACTFADAVTLTPIIPHEHELVHAVRGELGFSNDILEEGAAEIWGAHDDRSFDYGLSLETAATLAEDELPVDYYGVVGRFAAFVVSAFGQEAFVELGKLTADKSSPAELSEAFESVTGMTSSEVFASYEEAGWRCGRSVYRDDSLACSVAPAMDCSLAEDDGTLHYELDLDCGSEQFVGPRGGVIWSDVILSVQQSHPIYISVAVEDEDEDEVGRFSLLPCGVGCEGIDYTIVPNDPNGSLGVPVHAGQYLFRIELPADGRPRGKAVVTIRNHCEPRM